MNDRDCIFVAEGHTKNMGFVKYGVVTLGHLLRLVDGAYLYILLLPLIYGLWWVLLYQRLSCIP